MVESFVFGMLGTWAPLAVAIFTALVVLALLERKDALPNQVAYILVVLIVSVSTYNSWSYSAEAREYEAEIRVIQAACQNSVDQLADTAHYLDSSVSSTRLRESYKVAFPECWTPKKFRSADTSPTAPGS